MDSNLVGISEGASSQGINAYVAAFYTDLILLVWSVRKQVTIYSVIVGSMLDFLPILFRFLARYFSSEQVDIFHSKMLRQRASKILTDFFDNYNYKIRWKSEYLNMRPLSKRH